MAFLIGFGFLLLAPDTAFAGDDLFKDVTGPYASIFYELRPLIYGLASLAILGIGAMTIFGRRFSWGWLFAVIGALTILFLIEPTVKWVTDKDLEGLQANNAQKVFGGLEGKSDDLYKDAQKVIFALSGAAFVGLGVLSLFGRFDWSWFAAIVGGLFIVNVAMAIVDAMRVANPA